MKRLAIFVILLSAFATTAHAACAALPTGSISALRLGGTSGDTGVFGPGSTNHPAGTLAWDSTQGKPVYCDGSAWLVLASGGSGGGASALNVYGPTGTLLGRYLSNDDNTIWATNAANKKIRIASNASAAGNLNGVTTRFTGTNCTGTVMVDKSTANQAGYGIACTGSATCTSQIVYSPANTAALGTNNYINYASSRSATGACQNGNSSRQGYNLYTPEPTCGSYYTVSQVAGYDEEGYPYYDNIPYASLNNCEIR